MEMDGYGGFDEWFRSLSTTARGVARRIVGDADTADDVVAEAFARALVRWRRVQGLDHRDAWLLRVVTNRAIDVVRARPRHGVAAEPAGDVASPVDDADGVAVRMALAATLRALPKRQREVVSLRYLAGFTEDDVAAALGISRHTVHTHATRALAVLRGQVDPNWEDESLAY